MKSNCSHSAIVKLTEYDLLKANPTFNCMSVINTGRIRNWMETGLKSLSVRLETWFLHYCGRAVQCRAALSRDWFVVFIT